MARKWAREAPGEPSSEDLRLLRTIFIDAPLGLIAILAGVFLYWALFLS